MKKIKSFHKITISVFLTLLLFSGCDSWKTDLKADIDQESKDYCLFAPGSYWIYQDSATLEIDSTVIIDISYKKSTFAKPTRPFLFEEYIMNIQYFSKNAIKYNGEHILTSKYCDEDNVKDNVIKPIMCTSSIVIGENEEFKNGLKLIYHNGSIGAIYNFDTDPSYDIFVKYESYFSNFQIEEKMFSNVKLFTVSVIDYSNNKKQYQTNIYVAKYIGPIRTEVISEDTYNVRNLIKYDVNPYNQ